MSLKRHAPFVFTIICALATVVAVNEQTRASKEQETRINILISNATQLMEEFSNPAPATPAAPAAQGPNSNWDTALSMLRTASDMASSLAKKFSPLTLTILTLLSALTSYIVFVFQ